MMISRCRKDVRAQASPFSSYHLEGYDEFARASVRHACSCVIHRSQAALLVPVAPHHSDDQLSLEQEASSTSIAGTRVHYRTVGRCDLLELLWAGHSCVFWYVGAPAGGLGRTHTGSDARATIADREQQQHEHRRSGSAAGHHAGARCDRAISRAASRIPKRIAT